MVMTKPDVMPTSWDFIDTRLYDFLKNSFLQSSEPPATPVAERQRSRDPGISVSLVVRNTHRWGSRSVKKVMGPISKTRMLSGGSLTCPQPEKYMLCTFRKKSSTRNPWPLHQDSMARLSTQSFSSWYLLQKNVRQRTSWVVHFTGLSFISSHVEWASVWFTIFLSQWRPYLLIFSSTKKDKLTIFGYLFID